MRLAIVLMVVLAAGSAEAQTASDEFGIERFRLAMDRSALLDVDWAGMPIRAVSNPSLRRLATPARGVRASKPEAYLETDPTMLSPESKPDSKAEPKPLAAPAPDTLSTRHNYLPLILALVGLVIAGAVTVVVVVLTRTPTEVQMVHAAPQKRTDLELPPEPVQTKPVEPAAAEPAPPPSTPKTVAKPKTPDELLIDKLTAKFATRRSAVTTCFAAASTETISIRLQIDRTGKVTDAAVSPAASPAGACLVKVARETSFGPQPKAVVFHVPITAR